MKVKFVKTVLVILFSLCALTFIAQGSDDEEVGLATTEEGARNDRDAAEKAWHAADAISDAAYVDKNESDKVLIELKSAKGDIDVENRDNLEDIKEGAVELVADLASIAATRGRDVPISSLAATVINAICDVMDWDSLAAQLSDIESAITAETANNAMLQTTYLSALQTTTEAEAAYNAAYAHWLTFIPCAGCGVLGVIHPPQASCWNSRWGCPSTNVRECTHDCDYDPVYCRGCGTRIPNEDNRSEEEKAVHKEVNCGGCSQSYWLCGSNADYHRPRICQNIYIGSYYMGQIGYFTYNCNSFYRECSNSSCYISVEVSSGEYESRYQGDHDDDGAYDGACPITSGIPSLSTDCVLCN